MNTLGVVAVGCLRCAGPIGQANSPLCGTCTTEVQAEALKQVGQPTRSCWVCRTPVEHACRSVKVMVGAEQYTIQVVDMHEACGNRFVERLQILATTKCSQCGRQPILRGIGPSVCSDCRFEQRLISAGQVNFQFHHVDLVS